MEYCCKHEVKTDDLKVVYKIFDLLVRARIQVNSIPECGTNTNALVASFLIGAKSEHAKNYKIMAALKRRRPVVDGAVKNSGKL